MCSWSSLKMSGFGMAVGSEHPRKDIDEREARISRDVVGDLPVGTLHRLDLRPARGVRGNRDVVDARQRQRVVQHRDQRLEIRGDLLGAAARVDVVAAAVDHHQRRLVGDDDAIEERRDLGQHRPAESAVHDWKAREVFFQRRPQPDAGAAGEDDAAARRRIRQVRRLERVDFRLPARGIRPALGARACRQRDERKQGDNDQQHTGRAHQRLLQKVFSSADGP